ncbi:hypothetical protein SAMN04488519_1192, partial [Algoriphagus ornithinivorans]
ADAEPDAVHRGSYRPAGQRCLQREAVGTQIKSGDGLPHQARSNRRPDGTPVVWGDASGT